VRGAAEWGTDSFERQREEEKEEKETKIREIKER